MTRTRHTAAPLVCGALALGLAAGPANAAEKKAFALPALPTPAIAVPPRPKAAASKQPSVGTQAADRYDAALKKWGGPAEKGDTAAQLKLGRAFRRGEDTETNAKRALHWLGAAARANVPAAHYQLGLFYMAGARGREPDLAEAYARFKIAADGGDVRAAAMVFYIGVRMTAHELRRSHERIADIYRFETGPAVPTAPPPAVAATAKPSDKPAPASAARAAETMKPGDAVKPADAAKPADATKPADTKPAAGSATAKPAASTPAK